MLRRAAAENGYVTSDDCQRILKDLDEELVARVSDWLFSDSGLAVKEGVGQQYQQDVMRRVKSPRVEDVKDTKQNTHKNKNKFQKSKKKPDEVEEATASMNLNKVIDELKDGDDEFLPPWEKLIAQDATPPMYETPEEIKATVHGIIDDYWSIIPENAYFPELEKQFATVDPQNSNTIIKRLHDALNTVSDRSTLIAVWDRLHKGIRGTFEVVPDGQELTDWKQQEQTYELEEGPDIELAKASAAGLPKVIFDKGPEFFVAVAITPAQKAAGLEVVDRLSNGFGMLFPFEAHSDVTFHMGSVKFPIDIVFLVDDENAMKVGHIVHDAIPGSLEHWSYSKTTAVLEVCGGLCNKLGIKKGDVCHFARK